MTSIMMSSVTMTSCNVQVKCTDAWNISIKYDRTTANTLASKSYISEHDRRLRTLKLVTSSC